jgi:DNA modification methylase
MKYQLNIGHALDVLKTMPDESVHCCVTSPPYWGLRQYDIPDTVFGGLPGCDHVWGSNIKIHKGGSQGQTGKMYTRSVRKEYEKTKDIIAGTFCQKCGAWEGQLGLEPTPELYVDHIIEIFREVLRVLRSDGTLWLNLGDCYATGAGLYGDPGSDVSRARHRRNGRSKNSFTKDYPTHQPNRMPIPGLKPKDLVGIPWRVAFALQADGWYLRSDIIWHKPNPMPGSYKDRPTTAHEYIFLMSKARRYYYDHKAIKEPASPNTHARYARGRSDNHKWADGGPGNQTIAKSFEHMRKPSGQHNAEDYHEKCTGKRRPGVNPKAALNVPGSKQNTSFSASVKDIVGERNKRSVWTVPTYPYPKAHFATFPPDLIEPCILAGCPEDGTVLDPFAGSGTTGEVALKHFRKFIGIDLGPSYINDMARPRVEAEANRYKQIGLID